MKWEFQAAVFRGGSASGRRLVAAPLVEGFQKILDGLLLGPEIAVQQGNLGDRPGALLSHQLLDGRVAGSGIADRHGMGGRPNIIDLKIGRRGLGEWDVVGLFNWDPKQPAEIALSPEKLGLSSAAGGWVSFDLWSKQLVSAKEFPSRITVPPGSCRLLTLRRRLDHPQVVSTSRHVTQGTEDLAAVQWDIRRSILSGTSQLVAADPYSV